MKNTEIYKRVKQVPISQTLVKRTSTWIGLMLGRPAEEQLKFMVCMRQVSKSEKRNPTDKQPIMLNMENKQKHNPVR